MGTLPIHAPSADNELLILSMRMAFVAENMAIILNIILIALFYYQIKNESEIINKYLIHESIRLTWLLLIVGFLFSVSLGLVEDWLTEDCGVAWLQWVTFFFYALHRALLLFSFLHRLYFVFKGSSFSYPNWFYKVLFVLIFIYFIASFLIYGFDYGVTYVDIEMNTGFSGTIMCSWSFGLYFTSVARPMEIILTLILVIAFLYKLWALHKLNNGPKTDKTSKLLILFRKITILTLLAVATTVVVTFGYINYKPFVCLFSLDTVFNSFCVFLMLQFNQKFIRPCCGNSCNHCFCIKCDGCCKCRIVCGEVVDIIENLSASIEKQVSSSNQGPTIEVTTPTSLNLNGNLSVTPAPDLLRVSQNEHQQHNEMTITSTHSKEITNTDAH